MVKEGVYVCELATMAGIGGEAGVDLDPRRFRANIVLETRDRETFLEDGWVSYKVGLISATFDSEASMNTSTPVPHLVVEDNRYV
jgi:uncharacterized protein YcbX